MRLGILGPERPEGILPDILAHARVRGPVALISAGWRADEARDELLRAAIPNTVHNLRLYESFRDVERHAPDLARAWTRKQDALRREKERYRKRIVHALAGAQDLWADRQDPTDPWFRQAVADLVAADELFLQEAAALHRGFDEVMRPAEHPAVRAVRARVEDILGGCKALLVAGGHVGVLRNRMAFFGIPTLLGKLPLVAWSGGAMVLCDRVLLYHDHTAYGPGLAEMLDGGFGLLPGVVYLPHARSRLDLDARGNVAILAARLAPRRAIGLVNRAAYVDGAYRGDAGAAFELLPDGSLRAEGA
jgi:hypothetical protein